MKYFATGTYSYVQGDSAILHYDDSYTFHGRSDDVLNTGGNRVGVEQIENAILKDISQNQNSPLKNVVVIGTPHPILGEIATPFYTSTKDLTLEDIQRLKVLVKTEVGDYCIPEDFIHVPAFPGNYNWEIRS